MADTPIILGRVNEFNNAYVLEREFDITDPQARHKALETLKGSGEELATFDHHLFTGHQDGKNFVLTHIIDKDGNAIELKDASGKPITVTVPSGPDMRDLGLISEQKIAEINEAIANTHGDFANLHVRQMGVARREPGEQHSKSGPDDNEHLFNRADDIRLLNDVSGLSQEAKDKILGQLGPDDHLLYATNPETGKKEISKWHNEGHGYDLANVETDRFDNQGNMTHLDKPFISYPNRPVLPMHTPPNIEGAEVLHGVGTIDGDEVRRILRTETEHQPNPISGPIYKHHHNEPLIDPLSTGPVTAENGKYDPLGHNFSGYGEGKHSSGVLIEFIKHLKDTDSPVFDPRSATGPFIEPFEHRQKHDSPLLGPLLTGPFFDPRSASGPLVDYPHEHRPLFERGLDEPNEPVIRLNPNDPNQVEALKKLTPFMPDGARVHIETIDPVEELKKLVQSGRQIDLSDPKTRELIEAASKGEKIPDELQKTFDESKSQRGADGKAHITYIVHSEETAKQLTGVFEKAAKDGVEVTVDVRDDGTRVVTQDKDPRAVPTPPGTPGIPLYPEINRWLNEHSGDGERQYKGGLGSPSDNPLFMNISGKRVEFDPETHIEIKNAIEGAKPHLQNMQPADERHLGNVEQKSVASTVAPSEDKSRGGK